MPYLKQYFKFILFLVITVLLSTVFVLTRHSPVLNRKIAKIETKIARWYGVEAKTITIKGSLNVAGGHIQPLHSASRWSAMANAEGKFLLPEVTWYPGFIHSLQVSAPSYQSLEIEIALPSWLPSNSTFDVGELKLTPESSQTKSITKVMNSFPYDETNHAFYQQLFEKITAGKTEDEDKIEAVKQYVNGQRVHKKRTSFTIYSHSLREVLEQKAAYTCGDLSIAMATLTYAGGYPTRWIDMLDTNSCPTSPTTHVIVEVFYSGKWHLYDPTYGFTYHNKNGEIVSYKELRNNLELVSQPLELNDDIWIPKWLSQVYSSGVHCFYYFQTTNEQNMNN